MRNLNQGLNLEYNWNNWNIILMILNYIAQNQMKQMGRLKNVKDWMTNNVLLLNSDKTVILFIGPKNSTPNLLDRNWITILFLPLQTKIWVLY